MRKTREKLLDSLISLLKINSNNSFHSVSLTFCVETIVIGLK